MFKLRKDNKNSYIKEMARKSQKKHNISKTIAFVNLIPIKKGLEVEKEQKHSFLGYATNLGSMKGRVAKKV